MKEIISDLSQNQIIVLCAGTALAIGVITLITIFFKKKAPDSNQGRKRHKPVKDEKSGKWAKITLSIILLIAIVFVIGLIELEERRNIYRIWTTAVEHKAKEWGPIQTYFKTADWEWYIIDEYGKVAKTENIIYDAKVLFQNGEEIIYNNWRGKPPKITLPHRPKGVQLLIRNKSNARARFTLDEKLPPAIQHKSREWGPIQSFTKIADWDWYITNKNGKEIMTLDIVYDAKILFRNGEELIYENWTGKPHKMTLPYQSIGVQLMTHNTDAKARFYLDYDLSPETQYKIGR